MRDVCYHLSHLLPLAFHSFGNERAQDYNRWYLKGTQQMYVHSPQQTNSYDCGAFTLINIALLCSTADRTQCKHVLNADVHSWNTTQRIVTYSGKLAGLSPKEQSIPICDVPKGRLLQALSTIAASTSVSSSKARQMRRSNRNDHIVLDSIRPLDIITSEDKSPSEQLSTIVNRKCSESHHSSRKAVLLISSSSSLTINVANQQDRNWWSEMRNLRFH